MDPFSLSYRVDFGRDLKMTLQTHLPGTALESVSFEDALHTYFAISDIRSIAIGGLERTRYIDKVDQAIWKPASHGPIQFLGETDRVYFDTIADCVLTDEGMNRTVRVAKTGAASTVVWNPWIDKSKHMADFGDDEWTKMVCIETANVGTNKIDLLPGESHSTTAILSVVNQDGMG